MTRYKRSGTKNITSSYTILENLNKRKRLRSNNFSIARHNESRGNKYVAVSKFRNRQDKR